MPMWPQGRYRSDHSRPRLLVARAPSSRRAYAERLRARVAIPQGAIGHAGRARARRAPADRCGADVIKLYADYRWRPAKRAAPPFPKLSCAPPPSAHMRAAPSPSTRATPEACVAPSPLASTPSNMLWRHSQIFREMHNPASCCARRSLPRRDCALQGCTARLPCRRLSSRSAAPSMRRAPQSPFSRAARRRVLSRCNARELELCGIRMPSLEVLSAARPVNARSLHVYDKSALSASFLLAISSSSKLPCATFTRCAGSPGDAGRPGRARPLRAHR